MVIPSSRARAITRRVFTSVMTSSAWLTSLPGMRPQVNEPYHGPLREWNGRTRTRHRRRPQGRNGRCRPGQGGPAARPASRLPRIRHRRPESAHRPRQRAPRARRRGRAAGLVRRRLSAARAHRPALDGDYSLTVRQSRPRVFRSRVLCYPCWPLPLGGSSARDQRQGPVGAAAPSCVAHSSRGLGRRPLTAVTRVRIPYALPAIRSES
jgi:hypothetical protein